jgi:glycosyltransferase involved in cell wall biosynthesis
MTRALRAEIDRLRRANQDLTMELEDARSAPRAAFWHARRLWRAAWQRYYVARWHLLHARDPKKAFRPRDEHAPYAVRTRQPPERERARVLHFIGNFYTGGSSRLIVDLVEHLGHRYEQKVVARSLPPTPAYTGIDVLHRERLASPAPVLRILRSFRPDLVHVHMLGHQYDEYGRRDWSWYHRVFQAAEAYGCPVIENLNIPVEPYVSPAVRCYVHVSDYVKERFGRLDAWNETIHPGSDLDFFARPDDAPPPDDCIGMVYRLQPDKLDERAIEPFIEVVRRRPGTSVRIVGGGQYLEPYRRRVERAGFAGAFTFTGYVPYDELPAQLARMSVFVAPVHTESFGQVSPFAMGMKLPVSGYDVGALAEITALPELLAPPGDSDALARIIVDLLDDRTRRLRIGEMNRRRAEALFSVTAMVRRYDTLYREVLSTSRRAAGSTVRRHSIEPPVHLHAARRSAPVVSVVMAVRDGERHLREAMESILRQSYPDFELIVVDDASTDRTPAIIASYADTRVRTLRNEDHRGLSASLNRGIREARGRYIARIDADDVAEIDRFARQVDFLERHAEVAVVGSWYTIIDDQGRQVGRRWVPCDHFEIRWMLRFCSAFAHSAVMMRRSVLLDEIGPYDESLVYAMDYDLWLRLAAKHRVANLNEFLLRWRTSPTSMTALLGDGTERFPRVAADLQRRLGWSAETTAENERRADLLCRIVAGSPPDASLDDAAWAMQTLLQLHEEYCRENVPHPEIATALRRGLDHHLARCWLWLGHRYPDLRDYRYAWTALERARRLRAASVVSAEGRSLVAKLLGGRAAVAAVRAFNARDRAENPASAGFGER